MHMYLTSSLSCWEPSCACNFILQQQQEQQATVCSRNLYGCRNPCGLRQSSLIYGPRQSRRFLGGSGYHHRLWHGRKSTAVVYPVHHCACRSNCFEGLEEDEDQEMEMEANFCRCAPGSDSHFNEMMNLLVEDTCRKLRSCCCCCCCSEKRSNDVGMIKGKYGGSRLSELGVRNGYTQKSEKSGISVRREGEGEMKNFSSGATETSLNGWSSRLKWISSLESKNRRVQWICALESDRLDHVLERETQKTRFKKTGRDASINVMHTSETRQSNEKEYKSIIWNHNRSQDSRENVSASNNFKHPCRSTSFSHEAVSENIQKSSSELMMGEAKTQVQWSPEDVSTDRKQTSHSTFSHETVSENLQKNSSKLLLSKSKTQKELSASSVRQKQEQGFQGSITKSASVSSSKDLNEEFNRPGKSVSFRNHEISGGRLHFEGESKSSKQEYVVTDTSKFAFHQRHELDTRNEEKEQLAKETGHVEGQTSYTNYGKDAASRYKMKTILKGKTESMAEVRASQEKKQILSENKGNTIMRKEGKSLSNVLGGQSENNRAASEHITEKQPLNGGLGNTVLEDSNNHNKRKLRDSFGLTDNMLDTIPAVSSAQKMSSQEQNNHMLRNKSDQTQQKEGTSVSVVSLNHSQNSRTTISNYITKQQIINIGSGNSSLKENHQPRSSKLPELSRSSEEITEGNSKGQMSSLLVPGNSQKFLGQSSHLSDNAVISSVRLDSKTGKSAEYYKTGNVTTKKLLMPAYTESFYGLTDKKESERKFTKASDNLVTPYKLVPDEGLPTKSSLTVVSQESSLKSSSHKMVGMLDTEQKKYSTEIQAEISAKSNSGNSGNNSDESESNQTMFSAEGNEIHNMEEKGSRESSLQMQNASIFPGNIISEGPSEEVWAISGWSSRGESEGYIVSNNVKEKISETCVSEDSVEKPKICPTGEGDDNTPVVKSEKVIAKRSPRGLWGFLADFCLRGWALHESENATVKSGSGRLSNESPDSEDWHSVHELEDNDEIVQKIKFPKVNRKLKIKEPTHATGSSTSDTAKTDMQAENNEHGVKNEESKTSSSEVFQNNLHLHLRRRHSTQADKKHRSNTKTKEGKHTHTANRVKSEANEQLGMHVSPVVSVPESVVENESVPLSRPVSIGLSDENSDMTNKAEKTDIIGNINIEDTSETENMVPISEIEEKNDIINKLTRSKQIPKETFTLWEEALQLEQEQRKEDEKFMKEALAEAKLAADAWEVPVGAILVQNGKIIARAHNLVEENRDATAHAEMICIRVASNVLKTWRLADSTLYVTLEPCPMCAGAIFQARIGTIVWGAPNKLLGADGSWISLFPRTEANLEGTSTNVSAAPTHPFHPNIIVRRGVLRSECSEIMQHFFGLRRKKDKKHESQSCFSLVKHPSKIFSRFHEIFSIFCI